MCEERKDFHPPTGSTWILLDASEEAELLAKAEAEGRIIYPRFAGDPDFDWQHGERFKVVKHD